MSWWSAILIANEVGLTTEKVYKMWEKMGVIKKDKLGAWIVTELGEKMGGRMSMGDTPVPTFKPDDIIPKMVNFENENKKK